MVFQFSGMLTIKSRSADRSLSGERRRTRYFGGLAHDGWSTAIRTDDRYRAERVRLPNGDVREMALRTNTGVSAA